MSLEEIKNLSPIVILCMVIFILIIVGLRKKRADKQVEKNNEVIEDIETEKEKIKKETENIDETIKKAKEAAQKENNSQEVIDKIDAQTKKNESILEKYK